MFNIRLNVHTALFSFNYLISAPHQPRLDWQMWFAALGSFHYNPWFGNLLYRLLTGQKEGTCRIFLAMT